MAGGSVPNYFALLDLDPDVPWNEGQFEAVLQTKQREWSRLANHPTKGLAAQENLRRILDIRRALNDPAERRALIEAARAQRAAERSGAVERLDRELRLLGAKRYLLVSEVADIISRYCPPLTEADIRGRLRVEVRSGESLGPAQACKIEELLAFVKQPSLYAFLGLAPRVDRGVLLARARGLYDELNQYASKTPEISARAELAGFCLDLFGSDERRAVYDATLREAVYERLLEQVDIVGRGEKHIHLAQVEILLEEAQRAGLPRDEALRRIQARAVKQGWTIELPAVARPTAPSGGAPSPGARPASARGTPSTGSSPAAAPASPPGSGSGAPRAAAATAAHPASPARGGRSRVRWWVLSTALVLVVLGTRFVPGVASPPAGAESALTGASPRATVSISPAAAATPVVGVPAPAAGTLPTSVTIATRALTVMPAPTVTLAPAATPTAAEAWNTVLSKLNGLWGKDWDGAIALIDGYRVSFSDYVPAKEKLYAALVTYGNQLLDQGRSDDGVAQLARARSVLPNRAEAVAALVALTPTATPVPVAPRPATTQRSPQSAPAHPEQPLFPPSDPVRTVQQPTPVPYDPVRTVQQPTPVPYDPVRVLPQ